MQDVDIHSINSLNPLLLPSLNIFVYIIYGPFAQKFISNSRMHKLTKDNSSEYNSICLIEVLQLHM
jgi:hypothetical protein